MAKKTSKAPSGLTITRNGGSFTFSWKTGETYATQTLWYRVATSFSGGNPIWPGWNKSKKVGAKATSASIGVSSCAAVQFEVRGQAKKKKVSAWVSKTYTIAVPNAPSMGMSVINDHTSSFSWSTAVDNTSVKHFVSNQWQNALITNSNTSNGNAITSGWSGIGTTGAEGSWSYEEAGFDTIKNSYTRWVRARAVGWAGLVTSWQYARRVYAHPSPATNVSASRSVLAGSGYAVAVSWNSPETEARPIDSINIEYGKAIPVVTVTTPTQRSGTVTMSMSCPTSGVSWSSIVDTGGRSGKRTAAFTDLDSIPDDECFYVVIANKHDSNVTRSAPIMVAGGESKIVAPSAPVVGTPSGNVYPISVTRNTNISNAAIAIYFRTTSKQDEKICIGMIGPTGTSTSCIIPEVEEGDTFSFGAQAFVGDYTPYLPPLNSTSVTEYDIPNPLLTSEIVWGGVVPLPPKITAEPANESSILVTWNQSWADATQAELSWSENEDAWMSTSAPSTYIVQSINAGKWKIAGLNVGTYYVRVRLLKTEGENVSYSEYSETKVVKLSSSPDIPSLLLSSGVISKTGTVTCYWAYVSGDGTGQKQAQIFEAFPEYAVVDSPTGNPYESGYYEGTPLGTYTAVVEPTGNPASQGWYEIDDGEYVLTEDTEVDPEKTYYVQNLKYTRSLDTTVISGKTYYQTTGTVTYSVNALRSVESAQSTTLNAEEFGWLPGETHHLVVKVMSMSGEMSEGFSTPVPITIADELHLDIVSTNMAYVNVVSEYNLDDEPIATRSAFSMVEFPLEINVDGFESGSRITCIIDRADSYHVDRPDESEYEGFEGETVLMKTYDTANISISKTDLIGSFDDGASYSITLILNDAYGQNVQTSKIPTGVYNEIPSASYNEVTEPEGNPSELGYYVYSNDEYVITVDTSVVEGTTYYTKTELSGNPSELGYYVLVNNNYILTTDTEVEVGTTYYEKDFVDKFEIHWTHQAVMPSATVEVNTDDNVTFITPVQPESGYLSGDVCDIYRLSADTPVLIFEGAVFGTKYVDPYPAFGDFGGVRVVYRTYNDDYITPLNALAMVDYEADENSAYKHDLFGVVIDFDGNQLILPGNVSFSNKWSKDFTLTKYLGGAVQGDWNPAVERNMSAKVTIPVEVELENIELIRRLAVYSGICNIRTPDGSSFACNIDVNDDREEKWTTRLAKISLDITRCDPEGFDGKTYAEWLQEKQDET